MNHRELEQNATCMHAQNDSRHTCNLTSRKPWTAFRRPPSDLLFFSYTGVTGAEAAFDGVYTVFQALLDGMDTRRVVQEGPRLMCVMDTMLSHERGLKSNRRAHASRIATQLAKTLAHSAHEKVELSCRNDSLVHVAATNMRKSSSLGKSAMIIVKAKKDCAMEAPTSTMPSPCLAATLHVPECTDAKMWMVTWSQGVLSPGATGEFALASDVISVGAECNGSDENVTVQVVIPLIVAEAAFAQHACGVWDGAAFVRTIGAVLASNTTHVTCHVHNSHAQVAVLFRADDYEIHRFHSALPSSTVIGVHAMEHPPGSGAMAMTLCCAAVVLYVLFLCWYLSADQALRQQLEDHVRNKLGDERCKRAVDYLMIKALLKSRIAMRAKPWGLR
jgi:hypothetical protein